MRSFDSQENWQLSVVVGTTLAEKSPVLPGFFTCCRCGRLAQLWSYAPQLRDAIPMSRPSTVLARCWHGAGGTLHRWQPVQRLFSRFLHGANTVQERDAIPIAQGRPCLHRAYTVQTRCVTSYHAQSCCCTAQARCRARRYTDAPRGWPPALFLHHARTVVGRARRYTDGAAPGAGAECGTQYHAGRSAMKESATLYRWPGGAGLALRYPGGTASAGEQGVWGPWPP